MPCVQYVQSLGVSEEAQFVDVIGLDPDLLSTVPKPVLAVLLLFPTSDKVLCHTCTKNRNILYTCYISSILYHVVYLYIRQNALSYMVVYY